MRHSRQLHRHFLFMPNGIVVEVNGEELRGVVPSKLFEKLEHVVSNDGVKNVRNKKSAVSASSLLRKTLAANKDKLRR